MYTNLVFDFEVGQGYECLPFPWMDDAALDEFNQIFVQQTPIFSELQNFVSHICQFVETFDNIGRVPNWPDLISDQFKKDTTFHHRYQGHTFYGLIEGAEG